MKPFLLFSYFFVTSNFLFAQTPSPCSTEGHRQFDFWVGEWEVYDTKGDTLVGHNHIKRIIKDCVIEENWTGSTGFVGKSFNTYNSVDSTWNQVWVDQSGATYHFSGKYQDNVMALKGSFTGKQGTAFFKLTFYHHPKNNTVQQVWEMSQDNQATWSTIFDGTYKRPLSKKD